MDKNLCQDSSVTKGARAETLARQFLENKGMTFVEANFRWRGGELDLVMLDRGAARVGDQPSPKGAARVEELVFVEVRSSAVASSSWLRYSLFGKKSRRLAESGASYRLRRPRLRRLPFRFDVVWIENSRLEHWPNVALLDKHR